jgi:glycosyltransferase involved in cell wall biosynthesis
MEEKGNVLLCLEKMDIGGVETFVFNQALALKQKNYNVFVVAKEGVYVEKLKAAGIHFIDYDFSLTNYYDAKQIDDMVEIIKENKINEVHINQFVPAINMAMACILADVPYVVYLHLSAMLINTTEDTLDWFESQCFTYKENVEFILLYANKVIAISEKIKDYILERYPKLNKDKVIVLPNSINFKVFASDKEVKEIKNLLLITRFSNEKEGSIKSAIDFFKKYKEVVPDATLTIVGDGEIYDDYIDKYQEEINFIGATSNVKKYITETDLVLGLGRCILEALAMKRITVVCTYTETVGLITKDNIEDVMNNNFAGGDFSKVNEEKLVSKLAKLDSKEIEKIVNDNYSFIKDKLDIDKNLYVTDLKNQDYKVDKDILGYMIRTNCMLGEKLDATIEKMESDWKDHLKYVEYAEDKIASLEKKPLKERIKRLLRIKKRK